tara:strand:+ start:208 stop:975 length:768 start_codon:yes stop_codon:yes gene_type:complete
MEIYFSHSAGRMTQTDWQYSPVYATFDHTEWNWAANNGWLINEWEPPYWFQGRQVRLDLKEKQKRKHKFPKDLHFHVGEVVDLHRLDKIWKIYKEAKGFDAHLDFRTTCEYQPENKRIVRIYHNGKIIAFSLLRIYPVPVSLQFAWNYADPRMSVGIHTQHFEINYFRKIGYRYDYLCPGYEVACLWKTRFPGFQFWTGTRWISDKGLYATLCERDSSLNNLDQLGDLEDIDDDPAKPGIASGDSTWQGFGPRPY